MCMGEDWLARDDDSCLWCFIYLEIVNIFYIYIVLKVMVYVQFIVYTKAFNLHV